jgi:hypothetical protein
MGTQLNGKPCGLGLGVRDKSTGLWVSSKINSVGPPHLSSTLRVIEIDLTLNYPAKIWNVPFLSECVFLLV